MSIDEALEYSKKVIESNDFSPGYIRYHFKNKIKN